MQPPNVRQRQYDEDNVSYDVWNASTDIKGLLVNAFGRGGEGQVPATGNGIAVEDDDEDLEKMGVSEKVFAGRGLQPTIVMPQAMIMPPMISRGMRAFLVRPNSLQ